ncbi:MAG: alpha/beta hydrolase [Bdellovibrionales bacterium]|nr:alpha/beta hydrolase [Bdellovibrionales bacterium]
MMSFLFCLFLSLGAEARPTPIQNGLLEVRPGHTLYVNYRPATNGKPTLFLLNGLTYSTSDWKAFAGALSEIDPDIGLVLYDMEGMGQTLTSRPTPFTDIPLENQVEDLRALVNRLHIEGPISALGLSYGGAVGLKFASRYPRVFDQMIAMAPFLERLPEQDEMIKRAVISHRLFAPFDPRSNDELYDYYLRVMVAAYPFTEPVILKHPWRLEGVYRMVKGAKNWLATNVADKLPVGRVHIVGSAADEFVKLNRLENFLRHVPANTLASVMIIEDSFRRPLLPTQKFHKIPELHPQLAAAWVLQVLERNPDLQKGLTFLTDPNKGEARSGSIVIPLENSYDCATFLRKAPSPR